MPGRGQPWKGVGKGNPDRIGTEAIKDGSITEADLDTALQNLVNSTEGHVIEDEGTPLPQQNNLNFTGEITASDSGGKTVVDVPIGAGASVIGRQQKDFKAGTDIYPQATGGADPVAVRSVGTFNQQVRYIAFPPTPSPDTFAYFDWFPPKRWDPTFGVRVIVYWTSEAPSSASQIIDLQFEAVARSQGDAIGAVDFTSPIAFQTALSALDELQTSINGTTMVIKGGPAKGDWIQWKIRRKTSAGSLVGDIQLMAVRIEYNIDTATSTGL